MDPLLGSGFVTLLLLVLMLLIAERKARAANERRAHRTHRREPEILTPEELNEWRAKCQKARSDEVAALTKLDSNHAAKAKKRSGEWKQEHPDE